MSFQEGEAHFRARTQQQVNSMNTKPMIPVDQYFRELEAWAKTKECNRPMPDSREDQKAANVLDFASARKRLRNSAQ